MARQDINMDAAHGEVETTDNLVNKVLCNFYLLRDQAGEDNDNVIFCEVALPSTLATRCRDGAEIHVRIPYVADERLLKARLRTDDGAETPEYRLNPETNRPWYSVVWEREGNLMPVRMTEVWRCNSQGCFNMVLQGSSLVLYSGDETDFTIRPALGQNEAFLLKALAGNLYQFPTTGVGLIEFLHGNFENTGLATKLQSEFKADKMIINNAYMDSATGELILDVVEKNG